jgi:two-component system OmpR family sensor kinase
MAIPLRLRLTIIFTAAMAVVLIVLGTFLYTRLAADFLESVDLGLRAKAQVLLEAIDAGQLSSDLLAEGALIDADESFAQLLDGSGHVVAASPGLADRAIVTADLPTGIDAPRFSTVELPWLPGFDDPVRILAVAAGENGTEDVLVVGSTLGDLNDALAGLRKLLLVIGPAVLVATAVAGWLLAGAALRPVERMRREAAAVTASDLARRLPVPGTGDELARLATTLNTMLDRLQEAMERDHRFVDDASHELRTPLATLRAEIELALARDRPAADLEMSLRRALEDVGRLQRLADDLLVLARARDGRIPVRRVPSALPDLLRQSVQAVEPMASVAGVTIDVTAPDERVEVDPERLGQALRNLLENAIRHSPRGGHVRLTAERVDGMVRFVVEDPGPGFPDGLLLTAFEPFVRGADGAAASDGAGLGLTIVRAVADAHGGSAVAENGPGGARVTLAVRA